MHGEIGSRPYIQMWYIFPTKLKYNYLPQYHSSRSISNNNNKSLHKSYIGSKAYSLYYDNIICNRAVLQVKEDILINYRWWLKSTMSVVMNIIIILLYYVIMTEQFVGIESTTQCVGSHGRGREYPAQSILHLSAF